MNIVTQFFNISASGLSQEKKRKFIYFVDSRRIDEFFNISASGLSQEKKRKFIYFVDSRRIDVNTT